MKAWSLRNSVEEIDAGEVGEDKDMRSRTETAGDKYSNISKKWPKVFE